MCKWQNDGFVSKFCLFGIDNDIHRKTSQIRTQLWPKLSTFRLFQTFGTKWSWDLESQVTGSVPLRNPLEGQPSGFSRFSNLAHPTDGSDGTFRVLLCTVEIYEGITALPAHSALSTSVYCNEVSSVVAWTPTKPGCFLCVTGVGFCFMWFTGVCNQVLLWERNDRQFKND